MRNPQQRSKTLPRANHDGRSLKTDKKSIQEGYEESMQVDTSLDDLIRNVDDLVRWFNG